MLHQLIGNIHSESVQYSTSRGARKRAKRKMDTFWTAASLVLFSRGGEKYAKNWILSRMAWAEGPWVLRSFNSLRALLFLRQKKKMAVVASGTKFREVSKIFFCIWKNIDFRISIIMPSSSRSVIFSIRWSLSRHDPKAYWHPGCVGQSLFNPLFSSGGWK